MAAPSTSGRGRAALGILVAGYVAIDLLGSTRASPIRPPLPAGVGAPVWSATAARWIGLERLGAGWMVAVTLAVLAALVVAFAIVVAEALAGRVAARAVVGAAVLSIAIAVVGPLVISRDVSSYAAYGRIVAVYHTNPYVEVPADHPDDAFTPVVSVEWIRSRSVYGPAFTSISALVAASTRDSPAATIAGFKVLAGLAVGGAAWLAAAAARRRDAGLVPLAVALVGVNPVIVVHTVGGGHNDALVALGLAGAALVSARQWTKGESPWTGYAGWFVTVILTATAMVKVVALVPLAVFIAAAAWRAGRPRLRARVAFQHLAVAAVTATVFTAWYGWPAVRSTVDLASRRGWASAGRLAERGADAVGHGVAPVLRAGVAVVFAGAFLAILWSVVRRLAERESTDAADLAGGWATTMLGSALAGPYLLPWYAAWFTPLLGAVRDRAVIWIGVATCGVLTLTGVPAEPGAHPAMYRDALLAVHYVAAPLVAVLLAALVLRTVRAPRHARAAEDPVDDRASGPPVPGGIVRAP